MRKWVPALTRDIQKNAHANRTPAPDIVHTRVATRTRPHRPARARAHTHTHARPHPHTHTHTLHACDRVACKRILLAGLQLVDQLPALPKCQLELTQVALGNRFTLLHGAEEGVESVPFRSEGLLVVLEATCRKEYG